MYCSLLVCLLILPTRIHYIHAQTCSLFQSIQYIPIHTITNNTRQSLGYKHIHAHTTRLYVKPEPGCKHIHAHTSRNPNRVSGFGRGEGAWGPGQPADAGPARRVRQNRGSTAAQRSPAGCSGGAGRSRGDAATGQALEAQPGRPPPLRFDGVAPPVAGVVEDRERGTWDHPALLNGGGRGNMVGRLVP